MSHDLDKLKDHLRDAVEARTEKSKSGLYVCPLCGSGNGSHHTGALGIFDQGRHWKCQACGRGGDIFDFIKEAERVSNAEATRIVIEQYGGSIDSQGIKKPPQSLQPQPVEQNTENAGKDYTGQIEAYCKALEGCPQAITYLQGRGFTLETIKRWKLGYNGDAYNKQLRKPIPSIVIPYPAGQGGTIRYYITDPAEAGVKAYDKPKADEAGSEPLFNGRALYGSAKAVFVVESQYCAISIDQCGGQAVALGGTGKNKLIDQLKRKPTAATLILALDNDEPGRKMQDELKAALEAINTPCVAANIAGSYKDPNDRLQADPHGLRDAIKEAIEAAEAFQAQEERDAAEAYNAENAAGLMDALGAQIVEAMNTPAIATGFSALDKKLDGGLYAGLYFIGAVSSLGKTTFAMQIADNIATGGHDVLIISLEMSKFELMAKSISRFTYQIAREQGNPSGEASSTRQILAGAKWKYYSDEKRKLIGEAQERYKTTVGGGIWIKEGVGDISTADIRRYVERHKAIRGAAPVLIIDYLQIIAPHDVRATDKQAVDHNVKELKQISRDYKMPIIGISSFNRENYSAPVSMVSFKESGAIEYSSDCLIGLQYQGMEYQEGETDKDKNRMKRISDLIKANDAKARDGNGIKVDVKILKNRNGGRGLSDPLTFYPMFNYFIEMPEGFEDATEDKDNPFKIERKGRRF